MREARFPVKITMENRRRHLPAFLISLKADRISVLLPFTPAKSYLIGIYKHHLS